MPRTNTSTYSSSITHSKNIVDSDNQNELAGLKQRLDELKEKLDLSHKETRIVGVYGMPGIGKTTLVKRLYDEWKHKFQRHVHLVNIRDMSNAYGAQSLQRIVLKSLLSDTYNEISDDMNYETMESELLQKKVFLVFDDVSSKNQVHSLLDNHKWIRKGSRVVISTRNRTAISQLEYTYAVPSLDLADSLNRFSFYAFKDHNCPRPGNLRDLSTKFADYARDPDNSTDDTASEIRDLADKLLISISSGRVEMHDLWSTFAKKHGSSFSAESSQGNYMIWDHDTFASMAKNKRMRFVNQTRKNDQSNLKNSVSSVINPCYTVFLLVLS
ncbi:hypothetical protein YC2023_039961 [Brassica napus]